MNHYTPNPLHTIPNDNRNGLRLAIHQIGILADIRHRVLTLKY